MTIRFTSTTSAITWLASDAMYFHAARRAFVRAKAEKTRIDAELYRVEDTSVQPQPDQGPDLSRLYGPFLENLAVAHVMAASSLEAHINACAFQHLKAREFENFDKLSIDGKWLLLPRLLGHTDAFDVGSEPFQGFKRLIGARNALLHAKPRRETLDLFREPQPPESLKQLGLTIDSAEQSLRSASRMIERLATLLGASSPAWTTSDEYDAFEFSIDTSVSMQEDADPESGG